MPLYRDDEENQTQMAADSADFAEALNREARPRSSNILGRKISAVPASRTEGETDEGDEGMRDIPPQHSRALARRP